VRRIEMDWGKLHFDESIFIFDISFVAFIKFVIQKSTFEASLF
jgi:hypothetical protein